MSEAVIGEVVIVEDAAALAERAAAELLHCARTRPPVGIFLAGGTTPRAAYAHVAARATAIDLAGVHLWFGDERAVAIDHVDSNAGMVLGLWGAPLELVRDVGGMRMILPRCHTLCRGRDAAQSAAIASDELRALAGDDPRPALTLLGMGADGHTASLFPGDPALAASGLFVAACDGTRVTATRSLLAASRRVIILVAGASKAATFARVLAQPASLPAGQVAHAARARGAEVTWLVDRAAAAAM